MPYYMFPKSFPYVLSLSVRQDGYKLVLGIYLFLIPCIPILYSVNFIFKTIHKPVKPLEWPAFNSPYNNTVALFKITRIKEMIANQRRFDW